jgi:hypothetical protein
VSQIPTEFVNLTPSPEEFLEESLEPSPDDALEESPEGSSNTSGSLPTGSGGISGTDGSDNGTTTGAADGGIIEGAGTNSGTGINTGTGTGTGVGNGTTTGDTGSGANTAGGIDDDRSSTTVGGATARCNVAPTRELGLIPTTNFERVEMNIIIAGPTILDRCGLTSPILERFIALSAANTNSEAALWFATNITDGPLIRSSRANVVPLFSATSIGPVSANLTFDSANNDVVLFNGSSVLSVTGYFNPLSVELVFGSYVEYINSQQIVLVSYEDGFRDMQWTGIESAPLLLDNAIGTGQTIEPVNGISSGAIAGIVVGVALVVGLVGVIVVETVM